MPDYYICLASTTRAMAGPFPSPYIAAALIDVQETPTDYGTASRYELARSGKYPRNKSGDSCLVFDVHSSTMGYKDLVVRCANCGNELKYKMYHGFVHAGYDEHGAIEVPMTSSMEICGTAKPARQ
jgi:hypothetical protein